MAYHSIFRILLVEMNNPTRSVTKFSKWRVGLRKCQNISGSSCLKIRIQRYPTAYTYVQPHPTKFVYDPFMHAIHVSIVMYSGQLRFIKRDISRIPLFFLDKILFGSGRIGSGGLVCKSHRVSSDWVWKYVLSGRVEVKVSPSSSHLITSISPNYAQQFGQFVKNNSLHCKAQVQL